MGYHSFCGDWMGSAFFFFLFVINWMGRGLMSRGSIRLGFGGCEVEWC